MKGASHCTLIRLDAPVHPAGINSACTGSEVRRILSGAHGGNAAWDCTHGRDDLIVSSADTHEAQTTSLEFASRHLMIAKDFEKGEHRVRGTHHSDLSLFTTYLH